MLLALLVFSTVNAASPPTAVDRTCQYFLGKVSGRIERAHPALAHLDDRDFVTEWRESTDLRYRRNPDRWWTHGKRRWMIPSHVLKRVKPWFGRTVRECTAEDLRRAEDHLVGVMNGASTSNVGAEVLAHWQSRQLVYCIYRQGRGDIPVGLFHAWTETPAQTDDALATFVVRERLYLRQGANRWTQLTEVRSPLAVISL